MTAIISKMVSAYLQEYADAPLTAKPEPSRALVDMLRTVPKTAFTVLTKQKFDRPANLHAMDVDIPVHPMLTAIADLLPNLFIEGMTTSHLGHQYACISAAAASKSPRFVPTILELLGHRSIYIKRLVLWLIVEWPHLQAAGARPYFEKLRRLKTFQTLDMDRELLEKAEAAVAARAGGAS